MRNSIRQSLMELKGRPVKNMLIAAVAFVMVTFCGLAVFFRSSVNSFYQSFADMAGYSVVAEIDDFSHLDDWAAVIKNAVKNEHIAGYNNTIPALQLCQAVNFMNVPYDGAVSDNGTEMVYVSGNINTEYSDYFRNKDLWLTEGNFPSGDDGGIVIDCELALQNHLKAGDALVLAYHENRKSFRITGIYEASRVPKMEVRDGYYEVSPNSILFCSYGDFVELTGQSDCSMISFFVDDYDNMDDCFRHIEGLLSSVGNSVVMNAIANQEIQMSEVIVLMRQMTTVAITMVFVMCAGMMSLLIVLWLRSHSGMIAIYQILGQDPVYVMRVLITEISLVTIPSVGLAVGLMLALINRNSESMFFHLLDFCGIDSAQKSFSKGMWNFKMNLAMLIEGTGILELMILVMVTVGSIVMTGKSVRKLRQME